MFRFIGLAWNDTDPQRRTVARRLRALINGHAGWSSAHDSPGLSVHVAGSKPGVNGAYRLVGDRGVVLGKLFQNASPDEVVLQDVRLKGQTTVARSVALELIQNYWGRYVSFMNFASHQPCVLRDPSGVFPCFTLLHHGVWIVFSWLEDVLSLMPCVPMPAIAWDCVAGLAAHGELGGRATALCGVTQVLPGELVDLAGDMQRTTLLWSAARIAANPVTDEPDVAAAKLHETVRRCSRSWASCYDKLLLRLSGGLDSSVLISCLASDGCASDVICVNYHSAGSDGDERTYARAAAHRAKRDLLEFERDASFRLEQVIDVACMPTPVNYVGRMSSTRMDAQLSAAHGAPALFTGAGGDQIFFELRRWWPAADHLYLRGFDAGFFDAAMRAARLGEVSVWHAIAMALADRYRPPGSRRIERVQAALVRDEVARDRSLLAYTMNADLCPLPDLPIGKLNQVRLVLSPLSYYDPWEREFAPEAVSPLMSQPLVELCLRLPSYVLTFDSRPRGLLRKAFAGDLPTSISKRRSKGGIEDHVRQVLVDNARFARDVLLEGELVRHGILDRGRVEEALSFRPTTLVHSVSEIHMMIGIEAWAHRWASVEREPD